MWRFIVELYPITWLLWKLGIGLAPVVSQALDEEPRINPNSKWAVAVAERLTACENRGLAKLYLRVVDEGAEPLEGVVVTFGWESDRGMAYDHPNIFGLTDEQGFIEWAHFGVPTRYCFYMEDDRLPLVENIRTDLGREYCKPPGVPWYSGNIPGNRPGRYSHRFVVVRKGENE